PLRSHDLYLHLSRLGLIHSAGALFCRQAFGRALNVQHRPAFRKQRGELVPLYAANLLMVRTHAEDWNLGGLSHLSDVFDVTVQHDPADAGGHRGTSYLRQSGSTHRFENDSIGQGFGTRLDDVKDLLALDNGIIV